MIIISLENELPEYVGNANYIEYKIKSYHKNLTIAVQIKTRRMKLPVSVYGPIKINCVIDWQTYLSLSLCDALFSGNLMIHHHGFYLKHLICHFVLHQTTCTDSIQTLSFIKFKRGVKVHLFLCWLYRYTLWKKYNKYLWHQCQLWHLHQCTLQTDFFKGQVPGGQRFKVTFCFVLEATQVHVLKKKRRLRRMYVTFIST